jgi:hypothetical protein
MNYEALKVRLREELAGRTLPDEMVLAVREGMRLSLPTPAERLAALELLRRTPAIQRHLTLQVLQQCEDAARAEDALLARIWEDFGSEADRTLAREWKASGMATREIAARFGFIYAAELTTADVTPWLEH